MTGRPPASHEPMTNGGIKGTDGSAVLLAVKVARNRRGMVAMSGSSYSGWDAAGGAGGAVLGTVLGDVILTRRQRRLAREAARYFGPGEKLAAPVPFCYQGGRRVLLSGVVLFFAAIIVGLACSVTHNDTLTGAVFFGGMCAAVVVMWIAAVLAKNYAIVLTDQRLLLFRTKGRIRQRLREIEVSVPRDQVSMSTQIRLDGAAVSLSFAPATGIAPVLLSGGSPAPCARAVQEALTARSSAASQ